MIRPRDRFRLLLLVCLGLLVLVVRFSLMDRGSAVVLVRFFGYWIVLAIAACAVMCVVRAFKGWKFSWAVHGWPVVAALGCSLFLQIHEPHRLRVLYDEYVLLAISDEMHCSRQASLAVEAQYEDGRLLHNVQSVDKRPLLFPFLLSVIHDVSGFRIANVYVLNGLISLVLLWLVFWLGEAIGGRQSGYLGMLLVTGIPLVANVATGGSFDLLNMCLLAAVMLVAVRYYEDPSDANLDLLVMMGILIAQARYESILFLIPIAAIVAIRWWKSRNVEVTWLAVVSPLMLLLPLACNYVFFSDKGFTEQNHKLGIALFDPAYLVPNLGRAIYYLFDLSGTQTNAPLVSFAGVACMALALVGCRSVVKRRDTAPGVILVYYAFLPVIVGSIAMIMVYWWGHLDDPMASRLSLPLQLLLVVSILLVLSRWRRFTRVATAAIGLSGAAVWAWAIPVDSGAYATNGFFSANEIEWQVSTVLKQFDHRTLVVAESALPLIMHGRPAMTFARFNGAPGEFWRFKTTGFYKQIVIFQTIRVDPKTGKETDISEDAPGPELKLEPMYENRFQANIISRFSRLVGVEGGAPPSDSNPDKPEPTPDSAGGTPGRG